jgi:sirohydrochlorin ferrochelatase
VTDVEAQAALLQARRRAAVVAAYATAGTPTVADAVEHLRRRSGPVATAAFVLAPGSFAARIRAVGATWSAAPLGSHPAVAELTVRRYLDAAGVRDG